MSGQIWRGNLFLFQGFVCPILHLSHGDYQKVSLTRGIHNFSSLEDVRHPQFAVHSENPAGKSTSPHGTLLQMAFKIAAEFWDLMARREEYSLAFELPQYGC